jgi:hypothetical protein
MDNASARLLRLGSRVSVTVSDHDTPHNIDIYWFGTIIGTAQLFREGKIQQAYVVQPEGNPFRLAKDCDTLDHMGFASALVVDVSCLTLED